MSNVLIVGASSGIGLELAKLLSSQGIQVYGTYNSHPQEDAFNLMYQKFDVLEDSVTALELPDVLDGFVYCPGSILLKSITRLNESDFIDAYKLQVTGFVKTLQQILPQLKASNLSSVISFSSVAASIGMNFHSVVATNKAAPEGLTKALAAELSPQIRVNCIAPSITATALSSNFLNTEDKIAKNAERHPLKRIGSVADITQLCAFLLSENSSWMTGQVIHLDGGLSTLR